MRGNRLHWQVRGRTSSPTGDGSRRGCYGDMEFGIPRRFLCPGQGKKGGEGERGAACTGVYMGVRAVRPESVASGGWFEVLWNLECPVGLSQR